MVVIAGGKRGCIVSVCIWIRNPRDCQEDSSRFHTGIIVGGILLTLYYRLYYESGVIRIALNFHVELSLCIFMFDLVDIHVILSLWC